MSNAELATSYAALILADDGIEITVRRPATLHVALLSSRERIADAWVVACVN
jgi:hypothetical protein